MEVIISTLGSFVLVVKLFHSYKAVLLLSSSSSLSFFIAMTENIATLRIIPSIIKEIMVNGIQLFACGVEQFFTLKVT